MDVTLLKRVLFTLFNDQRLWIAAGAALLIFLIATLVAGGTEGTKRPKAKSGGAKKPRKMPTMPKMPSLRKKKEAPPPELDDDDPGADK